MRQMRVTIAALVCAAIAACGGSQPAQQQAPAPAATPAAGSGDQAFRDLAKQVIDDRMRRSPSAATDLGVHTVRSRVRGSVAGGDPGRVEGARRLQDARQRDRPGDAVARRSSSIASSCMHAMDAGILAVDVIRHWAKDPDVYSGGVTNAAYVIMKRDYAPPTIGWRRSSRARRRCRPRSPRRGRTS